MTLMISWIGVDSRSPASIYLLSDSRISWPDSSHFDYARKVFACTQYPDMFGYCGDVLFPSIALNQIVNLIDAGMLFKDYWSPEEKFEVFYRKIVSIFSYYPSQVQHIAANSFEIIYASRDVKQQFFCRKITWTKSTGDWTIQNTAFTKYSQKLFVIGSGESEFINKYLHYNVGDDKVSRSVFHCFCDTLRNTTNKTYGGAPQLVGLYRVRNSMPFGLIYDAKRYLYGLGADDLTDFERVEWRNELFENCDGYTMKIKAGAKRQPNPLAR